MSSAPAITPPKSAAPGSFVLDFEPALASGESPARSGVGGVASFGMGGHQGVMLTDEWLTPPEIIRALGPFSLDPCAPIVRPWPTAATHYSIEDDGLSRKWFGRVWLNPPYGPHTGTWLERLREHGDGIALIFARTETEAWFRHIWGVASGILFLRGRLNFHFVSGKRADKNSGAPSALIAYGENNAGILETCGIAGSLVRRAAGAGRGAEMRLCGTREKQMNAKASNRLSE